MVATVAVVCVVVAFAVVGELPTLVVVVVNNGDEYLCWNLRSGFRNSRTKLNGGEWIVVVEEAFDIRPFIVDVGATF